MLKITAGFVFFLIAATGLVHSAQARDDRLLFSIGDALESDRAAGKINPRVRMYFAGQGTPPIIKSFGNARTNKKTNAFNKTDRGACEWVFLSAIVQMQKKAEQLGANAIINIKSNYKNIEYASPTQFECGAGGILAGVALKGEFVVAE